MLKTVLASLVLVAATAGTAAAQYPPGYVPEVHDHEGFFGRVFIGPAYLSSTIETIDGDLTVSGGGASVGFAGGYSVTPNVVVYGELFADMVVGPKVQLGGVSGTASEDVSFGVGGLGIGAAYYFVPQNFFISGTLAFTALSADFDGEGGEEPRSTETGPGISVMGGKEWWIGRNSAVGVAAQLFAGSQPEPDDNGTWHTTAVSVAVTLTYN